MALKENFQDYLDAEMDKIRENRVERAEKVSSLMNVLDTATQMKSLKKTSQSITDECIDLTEESITTFDCKTDERFPFFAVKSMDDDYVLAVNIDVKKSESED